MGSKTHFFMVYQLPGNDLGKKIVQLIFNGGRIIRLNADGTNLVTLASNVGGMHFWYYSSRT
jgi:hypothetical protein